MQFKKYLTFLLIVISFLSFSIAEAQSQNVGFVPSNIWYSIDPLEEGKKVQVYTLVFNPAQKNLKGTLSFFDKTTLIGKKDFTIEPTSAEAIFIDWTVTVGAHEIFARIDNPRFEILPGKFEEIYLSQNETERSEKVVAKKLPNLGEAKDKLDEALESSTEPIINLQNKIIENTPPYIANPISRAFSTVDTVRESFSQDIEAEKEIVRKEIKDLQDLSVGSVTEKDTSKEKEQAEIEALENAKSSQKKETVSNMEKPFKYVKLFFLTLISYIFKYPAVFYVFIILAAFFIIRFLIRRFSH